MFTFPVLTTHQHSPCYVWQCSGQWVGAANQTISAWCCCSSRLCLILLLQITPVVTSFYWLSLIHYNSHASITALGSLSEIAANLVPLSWLDPLLSSDWLCLNTVLTGSAWRLCWLALLEDCADWLCLNTVLTGSAWTLCWLALLEHCADWL